MLGQSGELRRRTGNGRSDFGSQRVPFHALGLGNQHFLDVSGTTAVTVWSPTVDFALAWGIWGCLGLTRRRLCLMPGPAMVLSI